jgi:hypothetical protein
VSGLHVSVAAELRYTVDEIFRISPGKIGQDDNRNLIVEIEKYRRPAAASHADHAMTAAVVNLPPQPPLTGGVIGETDGRPHSWTLSLGLHRRHRHSGYGPYRV